MTQETLNKARQINHKIHFVSVCLDKQRIAVDDPIELSEGFMVYRTEPYYNEVDAIVKKLRSEYLLKLEEELASL